jgi:hypothetical protein
MRISKLILTICTAGICAGFISVRAEDNPAQAAARAALMEKMNEMDAPSQNQTSAPTATEAQTPANAVETPPAPVIVTTNGATTEEPAPAMTNSPPLTEPMPETIPAETNVEEVPPAMPETNSMPMPEPESSAMTNGTETPPMTETNATEAAPATPMMEPAETPAITNGAETSPMMETNNMEASPAPPMTNSMPPAEPTPETIFATTNAAAMTNAAASPSPQRIQPDAVGVTQPKVEQVKVEPAATNVPASAQNPAFPPIVAPPLPISASKEARLQALDAKYEANQISPAEYFKQREAILNEP